MELLLLSESEVRRCVDPARLLRAVAAGLRAVSDGVASVPPRGAATAPSGWLAAMPGYLPGVGMAAKLVSYAPGNAASGEPVHRAVIAVFDPESGAPVALLSAEYLTAARTAAAACVAARAVAGEVRTLAVVGSGAVAKAHVELLPHAFPGGRVVVAARTRAGAERVAGDVGVVAGSIEAGVRAADVVFCCTDAPTPVLCRQWLRPGAHVSSVGSGLELDAATVTQATVFVESRAVATLPFPAGSRELAGRDPASVVEIGEVLLGRHPGRRGPEELTVYKSMGHAAEDVAAAAMVCAVAAERALGVRVGL